MNSFAGVWSGLSGDIRDALRSLRHSGSFSAWVVGSLAVGMAVAIAALALLNAALVLPFQGVTDQDRLVRVSVSENCGRPDCWRRMFTPDDYRALQDGLHSVQGLAAYTFGDVSAGLPDARLHEFSSLLGHDAFLKEADQLRAVLSLVYPGDPT